MECPICIENTSEKRTISCPSCNRGACFNCIEGHIKNIKSDDIKCLFCQNVWTPIFLQKTFPLYMIFGNGVVRKHTEKNIFEREKALLPETQMVVAEQKHRRALMEERRALKERLVDIQRELITHTSRSNEPVPTKPLLVCGCPSDGCRGFILRPKYACGICDVKICKSCHKVAADGHECLQDDIESVKFIKKDTKPCPGCAAPSKKMVGCSQVWCRGCQKAWNWNTGQLDTGYIHATDYFNYMRAQGLAIPDRPNNGDPGCGRAVRYNFPGMLAKIAPDFDPEIINRIQRIFQKYCEFQYIRYDRTGNEDLRIKYLTQGIDETKWKALLLRREKENLMREEIQTMCNSFRTVLTDLFIVLGEEARKKDVKTIKPAIDSILGFHQIILDEWAILAKSFQSKRSCPFE